MQTINLTAWNNQIFRATFPMDNWTSLIDLGQCKLISFVKKNQSDTNFLIGFSSYGEDGCNGTLNFDETTKKLVFFAEEKYVEELKGDYYYDLLADDGSGRIGLFGGTLHFNIGVTT